MFSNTKKVAELEEKVAELEEKVQELDRNALKHLAYVAEISKQVFENQTNINDLTTLVKKHLLKQGGKKKTKKLKGRITRKGKTMKRRIIV